jgi:hypothetical protein
MRNMRTFLLLLCLALMCSSNTIAFGAAADDDDDDAAPAKPATTTAAPAKPGAKPAPEKAPAKAPRKKSSKSSKGKGIQLSSIGHAFKTGSGRAAAIAAGFAIGTPVAAVRLIARADNEQSEAVPVLGESKNKALQAMAHVLVIPSAFFSGTVQAPVYSAINAWKESDDNPFGPESFFLGDLDSRVAQ